MIRIMIISLLLLLIPLTVLGGPYDVPTKIPDTGQTQCYDTEGHEISCAGTGQDGDYSINEMSFTSLGNGTMVQDNVTGLIWEVKSNKDGVANYDDPHDADNIYTWHDPDPITNGGHAGTESDHDTLDFIKALNNASFGGYSDWRMPSREELRSIVNYSVPPPEPTIDLHYFPNNISSDDIDSSYYWSSTTDAPEVSSVWIVGFYYGNDVHYNSGSKSGKRYVRAVRGGAQSAQAARFVDNGDGTVTDTRTGLIWEQKTSDGGLRDMSNYYSWQNALKYCKNLELAGQTDWRMPNIKELASLVDLRRLRPAIAPVFRDYTVSQDYWSSTTWVNGDFDPVGLEDFAWTVWFTYGHDNYSRKETGCHVRAVRGGHTGPLNHSAILISGTVSPQLGTPGQPITFTSTWSEPDGDYVVDVKLRYYRKGGVAEWTEIPTAMDYVSDTDPPKFTKTLTVGGETGAYEYQFQASDAVTPDGAVNNTTAWQEGGSFTLFDLMDVINALKTLAGRRSSADLTSDVNEDGKIGLQDAIYLLRIVSR